MIKVLYISTFQFSGSTLLSFLLNSHSRMTTVGHTTGWQFNPDEDFRCSCGQTLDHCRFFRAIAAAYEEASLEFDVRNFRTAYSLVGNDRLNRLLTGPIPLSQNSTLERLRDRVVRMFPTAGRSLDVIDRSNVVFLSAALKYNEAEVYVDNSQDPYRFRHLLRLPDLTMRHLHLIRDPRGVVLSCRRNSGLGIGLAMQLWIRRHSDIFRLANEAPDVLTIHYDDLCAETDATLARIHDFAGAPAEEFTGDFKKREHHILGNDMRLKAGEIRKDTRWKTELKGNELDELAKIAGDFVASHGEHPMTRVLRHYFEV